MERSFENMLKNEGLTVETLAVLEKEEIVAFNVFKSLREEHFEKLSSKLAIGQHALLLKVWDCSEDRRREVSHILLYKD